MTLVNLFDNGPSLRQVAGITPPEEYGAKRCEDMDGITCSRVRDSSKGASCFTYPPSQYFGTFWLYCYIIWLTYLPISLRQEFWPKNWMVVGENW